MGKSKTFRRQFRNISLRRFHHCRRGGSEVTQSAYLILMTDSGLLQTMQQLWWHPLDQRRGGPIPIADGIDAFDTRVPHRGLRAVIESCATSCAGYTVWRHRDASRGVRGKQTHRPRNTEQRALTSPWMRIQTPVDFGDNTNTISDDLDSRDSNGLQYPRPPHTNSTVGRCTVLCELCNDRECVPTGRIT